MVWNYEWLDEVEEYIFADVSLLLTQWEGTLIITRPTEYFRFHVREDPTTILSPIKKQFCNLNKVPYRVHSLSQCFAQQQKKLNSRWVFVDLIVQNLLLIRQITSYSKQNEQLSFGACKKQKAIEQRRCLDRNTIKQPEITNTTNELLTLVFFFLSIFVNLPCMWNPRTRDPTIYSDLGFRLIHYCNRAKARITQNPRMININ